MSINISDFITEFEIEFIDNIRRLGLKKKDVANKLEMTMPTLNSKIKNPQTLNLKDIENLKELNFNLKTILNESNENSESST
ncbi:MAG: hypothetical protein Unbinned1643contig1000_14 [Prokaryotic dsDNA virus sp.]|mgnify:FL=1|nr:MAG: hypothetical protein Unbinned1643contig1000_14 [Prokaryotic dsDNA virus sp.]|tara:strand:- start:11890 stop:12135 length:246 start_codon:yes stop_codon:yes gene_type:complete